MKNLREFMKKHPLVYAVLGILTIWVAIKVLPTIECGGLTLGVHETVAAVFVLFVYWLLSGSRDLKPNFCGFAYNFRVLRYLMILQGIVGLFGLMALFSLLAAKGSAEEAENTASLIPLLNAVVTCAFVGIVEEFTFRGMVFGGLCAFFSKTKKGLLAAAAVSGIAFGFIHVANEVFTGQITSGTAAAQVVGKTIQAGVFGFVIALLYFRTRSIWAAVLLHGLNDFLLFLVGVSQEQQKQSYVTAIGDSESFLTTVLPILLYLFFTLLFLPAVFRILRDLKKDPQPYVLPMDEDFIPRKLVYEKPAKKAKK